MTKVLFIEDETTLQKTLSEILKSSGFSVQNAYDGEAGLALAKKSRPNIILLDLILPKMDGFAVLAELKKDEQLKDTPVIVLTNLEAVEDVEKVIALGATTYLVKANYDLPEIVAKIKEILGK
ncbi:response regulator [Candidatus Azambacteria bacterium]|nr:response regulator [Candidatus Azambacteria bacterium]